MQAARETLRVTEQAVLLIAVTAYMNLLRDSGDPRSAAAQRRGAAGAIASDPRPLQCRAR